jgi:putative (di)nucleoside polyphosphate hydrolase
MLRMLGGEDRLRFDLTAEPEFDSWRWVDYWSPVREVIYFKRNVYARALDELGRQAFPDGPPPRPEWWSEAVLQPSGRRPARPAAARPAAPVAE